jgi:hypothetical protein
MDLEEARREFLRLSVRDRARATRRASSYREACRRARREPTDAATWLAERTFMEAERIAKAQGTDRVVVARGTDAWNAWAATRPAGFPSVKGPDGKTGRWFASLWPPAPAATPAEAQPDSYDDIEF